MAYQALSPDGIDIAPRTYPSRASARRALMEWVKRYTMQGYYRDNRWNKIPLAEIINECSIIQTS